MAHEKCKRLIVACDGTWMNSDNGFERDSWLPWNTEGHLQVPSNVTRICRALRSDSAEGVPQIVHYQSGIGTTSTVWDRLICGTTGLGMSESIREGYTFIASNYCPGDEIFLLGFSRGAFTARSIAGLISAIGLLTRRGMVDFYPIFKDWENQIAPGYVSQWPDKPFSSRPPIKDPSYAQKLEGLGLSILSIPIKAVGVWDTVGSLGVPDIGLWPKAVSEYSFVNTAVSPNVEHAFQALALDEHRRPFSPTIWEKPKGQALLKVLKQCWFPGVHASIGGGYPDTMIADLTLAWMMNQLDKLLEFDPDYLSWQRDLNVKYYQQQRPSQEVRPWSLGKIYNSMEGLNRFAGTKVRTPGQYTATDPRTGASTDRSLRDTNEYIHISVRLRMALGGLGPEDRSRYHPTSLKSWTVVQSRQQDGDSDSSPDVAKQGRQWMRTDEHGVRLCLPEEELGDIELKLLATSPDVYRKVLEHQ